MTTWDDVRAAFAARLPLEHDRPGWLGVLIDGVLVRVEAVTVRDAPWLLFLSTVCYETDLPHRDALAMNLRLAVGSLALNGQRYELRQVVPLQSVKVADLPDIALEIAAEAKRLAAAVDARTRAATLFSTFKE